MGYSIFETGFPQHVRDNSQMSIKSLDFEGIKEIGKAQKIENLEYINL